MSDGEAASRSIPLQERVNRLPEDVFTGGPRVHFESRGRLQLITLLRCGLYPGSRVLDIGCGCLRGGYWLIHFLGPDRYCGIEPDQSLVETGLQSFFSPEELEQKRPRFDHNADFDASVFGERFDFFLARSIFTHATPSQIEAMLDAFESCAHDDALFLASYKPRESFDSRRPSADGDIWVGRGTAAEDTELVTHSFEWVRQQCSARGMTARELNVDFLQQVWLTITKDRGKRAVDEWLAPLQAPLWYRRGANRLMLRTKVRGHVQRAAREKELFFTVTTGRSGTDFLAKLGTRLPGLKSVHEPAPMFVHEMRTIQTDPERARRFWVEEKLPRIAHVKYDRYLETSHLFCKGYLEPLLELDVVPNLILLSRAHRQVATSLFMLRTTPTRTLRGDRWYLRPDDPAVLPLPGWEELHDYQICYWYCLEIARRQREYADRVRERGGRVLEIDLDELLTQSGLARLSHFLIGRGPSLAARWFLWRSRGRPQNTKIRSKARRRANLPEDLDALEQEVHEVTGFPKDGPTTATSGRGASGT